MWYHAKNNQQHGPFTEADLKDLLARREITPHTLVWKAGMAEWIPLEKTGLASAFKVTLPEGDAWEVCAFSGERGRRSEMSRVDDYWIHPDHRQEAEKFVEKGGWLPTARSGLRLPGRVDLDYLVARTLSLLKPCAPTAAVLYLAVTIPVALVLTLGRELLTSYWKQFFNDEAGMAIDGLAGVIVGLGAMVLTDLSNGGIIFLLRSVAHGKLPKFEEAWRAGVHFWGAAAGTNMLNSLLLFVALLVIITPVVFLSAANPVTMLCGMFGFMLVFPGMIIFSLTLVAVPAVVERRLRPMMAMRYAWAVTQGHGWRTFGYYTLFSLLIQVPADLLLHFVNWMAPKALEPVFEAVFGCIFALPSVFFLAFLYCYYKELEARFLALHPDPS